MRNHELKTNPVAGLTPSNVNYYLSLRYLFLRIQFLDNERSQHLHERVNTANQ